MKIITENKEKFTIVGRQVETEDTVTLKLVNEKGVITKYNPGQFITVFFPELNTPEGKSYSISSHPREDTLNITVKAMGQFSNKLFSLKINDKILISPPYGFFFSENTDKDITIFAAGIGIAPFRSVIYDSLVLFPDRKILLNLSNKSSKNIIFKKELSELEAKFKNFKTQHYITQEDKVTKPMIKGRVNVEKSIKKNTHSSKNEYFICGSISFVRDIWNRLRDCGVSEDYIYTEAFFSH